MNRDDLLISKSLFYIFVLSNVFSSNFYSMLNNEIKNLIKKDDDLCINVLRKIKKLSNNYYKLTNEFKNKDFNFKYKNKDEKIIKNYARDLFKLNSVEEINNNDYNDYKNFLFKIISHSLSLNNFFFNLPIIKITDNSIDWNNDDFIIKENIKNSEEVKQIFKKLKNIRSGIIHNSIYINDKKIFDYNKNNKEFIENDFKSLYKYIYKTLISFLNFLEKIEVEDWFLIKNIEDVKKFILIGKNSYLKDETSINREELLNHIININDFNNKDFYRLKGLHRSTIILIIKREIKNLYNMLITKKHSIYFEQENKILKEKNFYSEKGEKNKINNISKMIDDIIEKNEKISLNSEKELKIIKKEINYLSLKNDYKKSYQIVSNIESSNLLEKYNFSYKKENKKLIKFSSRRKVNNKVISKDQFSKIKEILKNEGDNIENKKKKILNELFEKKNNDEKENFSSFLNKFLEQKDFNYKNFEKNFILKN